MSRSIVVNRSITAVAVNADESAVLTLDCGHPLNQTSCQLQFVNLAAPMPCPQCASIAATAQGLPA